MKIPDASSCSARNTHQRRILAFSLLEVMIAMGIFFMALFGILGLVAQTLKSARSLNQNGPTPGWVASKLSMTNKLFEGSESGDFEDVYPDHSWVYEVRQKEEWGVTNLFEVEIAVLKKNNIESTLTLLLFRPESTGGVNGPGAGTGTRGDR